METEMKLESIRKLIEATPMEPWTPYKDLMPKLLAVAEAAHAVNELFNYQTMHALDDALAALESD
jgi:hypothetical protein